jgi:hypothetical protein
LGFGVVKGRACIRAAAAVAIVFAVVAGAGCADDPEERRAALAELVEAYDLQPLPGDADVRISRVRDTNGYPYYVATGVVDEPERTAGMARVATAFEREGWDVFESGPVDFFLGACVRAQRGSMVAAASVGWVTGPGFNPYPRLPGRLYVQAKVGHEDSNQTWAHPDRPRCGAE